MKSTAEIIRLLQVFKTQQAEKYGIFQLGIFGSVARNEQKETSDVDIYYEGRPIGLFSMAHMKNELEELLGCSVDIVRLRDRMNQLLKKASNRRVFMCDKELLIGTRLHSTSLF